jgi:hypothetical protein
VSQCTPCCGCETRWFVAGKKYGSPGSVVHGLDDEKYDVLSGTWNRVTYATIDGAAAPFALGLTTASTAGMVLVTPTIERDSYIFHAKCFPSIAIGSNVKCGAIVGYVDSENYWKIETGRADFRETSSDDQYLRVVRIAGGVETAFSRILIGTQPGTSDFLNTRDQTIGICVTAERIAILEFSFNAAHDLSDPLTTSNVRSYALPVGIEGTKHGRCGFFIEGNSTGTTYDVRAWRVGDANVPIDSAPKCPSCSSCEQCFGGAPPETLELDFGTLDQGSSVDVTGYIPDGIPIFGATWKVRFIRETEFDGGSIILSKSRTMPEFTIDGNRSGSFNGGVAYAGIQGYRPIRDDETCLWSYLSDVLTWSDEQRTEVSTGTWETGYTASGRWQYALAVAWAGSHVEYSNGFTGWAAGWAGEGFAGGFYGPGLHQLFGFYRLRYIVDEYDSPAGINLVGSLPVAHDLFGSFAPVTGIVGSAPVRCGVAGNIHLRMPRPGLGHAIIKPFSGATRFYGTSATRIWTDKISNASSLVFIDQPSGRALGNKMLVNRWLPENFGSNYAPPHPSGAAREKLAYITSGSPAFGYSGTLG